MNALWIVATIMTPLGLTLFVGNRLFKQSLKQEGLCPVCSGVGGPCKYCNGVGVITPDSDKDKTE